MSDLSSEEEDDGNISVGEEDHQTLPPQKCIWTALTIPACVALKEARALQFKELQEGLVAIEKKVRSSA